MFIVRPHLPKVEEWLHDVNQTGSSCIVVVAGPFQAIGGEAAPGNNVSCP